jgi:P pilus assembly chaperone PapD
VENRLKTMFFVYIASMVFCVFANAGVLPDSYNIYLSSPTAPIQELHINNTSDSYIPMRARLYLVAKEGGHREEVFSLQDSSVTASPRQFSVAPHAKKTINIKLATIPVGYESHYQLELVPLQAKTVVQTMSPLPGQVGEKQESMSLLISHIINIHVNPVDVNAKLAVTRLGNKTTITNDGDISIFIKNIQQCFTNNNCISVDGYSAGRIFPGKLVEITTKKSGGVIKALKVWGDSYGKEHSEFVNI